MLYIIVNLLPTAIASFYLYYNRQCTKYKYVRTNLYDLYVIQFIL